MVTTTNDDDVFRGKGPLRVNMPRGKKFETSRNYRVEKKNIENQCLPKLSKRRLFWSLCFPLRTLEWMIQMIYIRILFFVVKISQTRSNITHFVGSEIPSVTLEYGYFWVFVFCVSPVYCTPESIFSPLFDVVLY